MKENYFENEYVEMWIEDGIVYEIFKADLSVTLEVAKKIVADRLKTYGAITYPFFIDIRGLVYGDIAARRYFVGEESICYVSAGAILTNNFISRFAGNVFIKIDKPSIPTRLFTNKKKAILWLEQYKSVRDS